MEIETPLLCSRNKCAEVETFLWKYDTLGEKYSDENIFLFSNKVAVFIISSCPGTKMSFNYCVLLYCSCNELPTLLDFEKNSLFSCLNFSKSKQMWDKNLNSDYMNHKGGKHLRISYLIIPVTLLLIPAGQPQLASQEHISSHSSAGKKEKSNHCGSFMET